MDGSVEDEETEVAFSKEELRNVANRRHPSYDRNIKHWDFLELSYKGGPEYFSADTIFAHYKEGSKYKDRLKRAYRYNHTREVVDLVNKYVFKGNIVRSEDAPDYLQAYWAESSWERRGINQFISQVSTQSSIFGRPWIVVDTSDCGEAGRSGKMNLRQQKDLHRVYTYIVRPQDARDWSYDDDGCLQWFITRETRRDDANPFKDLGAIYTQYKLWTKNEWYLIEDERTNNLSALALSGAINPTVIVDAVKDGGYKLVDSGVHGLGRVPVIPANHLESPEGEEPIGLISDIAYLDRASANYLSNLDEIIQQQTFSQLAIPIQGLQHLPDAADCADGSSSSAAEDKLVEMGTRSIFTYDGSNGAEPHYLNPDPAQAGLIMEAIGRINSEIYSMVGLSAERSSSDNSVGIDHTSGVSKAFDFDRVNSLLVSKGHALQHIENEICQIVALYNGDKKLKQDYVTYSDDYDTRNLNDDMALIKELTEVAAPDAFRKKVMWQVVEKTFPQLPEKVIAELKADIAGWKPLSPLDVPPPTPVAGGAAKPEAKTAVKPTKQKPVAGKKNNQGQATGKGS